MSFCSSYGLTKHKESCNRPFLETSSGNLVFTCPECKRTFGERRYLLQHVGSKKCSTRKEILDRTASLSLALTESASSTSTTVQVSLVSMLSLKLILPFFRQLAIFVPRSAKI